jgi:hypothetical protein
VNKTYLVETAVLKVLGGVFRNQDMKTSIPLITEGVDIPEVI